MLRRAARALLAAFAVLSFGLTIWAGVKVAQNPALGPVVTASLAEITATTDRLMAREATPARLSALITARLAETPRNWVALQALEGVVAERGLALPAATRAAYDAAWAEDNSLTARATDCAACIWDAATCSLSNALICQAPVALTPLGDLAGITRAGVAYAGGQEVDQIDLGLSILGLGATAFVVASGGSSVAVKVGASTAKLARRMGLLSPRLTAMATDAVRTGVRWADLPAARSADDLAALVRMEAFAPLIATAKDLGRLRAATSTTDTLHLLRQIDTAADARRLATAAEALGPRTLGRVEVLGKARVLRATIRVGDTALALMTGLIGSFWAMAAALGHALQSALLRAAGRALR